MTRPRLPPPVLVALAVGLIGFVVACVAKLPVHTGAEDRAPDVEDLVLQLRAPANKAKVGMHVVPGGEMMTYSPPMDRLVEMGDAAREPLVRYLNDEGVQNEVALVLGEIGDESTVPFLIQAFPENSVRNPDIQEINDDPVGLKVVCFTKALMRLTGRGIGHTRWGTEFKPGMKRKWQDWWAESYRVFWVEDHDPRPERTTRTTPEILHQLDTALIDTDPKVRRAAAGAYWQLGSRAKPSVPNLIVALRDTDPDVRRGVAYALSDIGPDASEAIPALVEVQRDDAEEGVRDHARYALSKIGPAAMPPLLEMLDDKDPLVRRHAIHMIGGIDPKQKSVVPRFLEFTKDDDPKIRETALAYLQIIDEENPEVLQALITGLGDPEAEVRRGCAYHLGRMKTRAAPATGVLAKIARDKQWEVRRSASEALVEIGSLTREHVPLLIDLLADESWEVRSDAARGLDQLGSDASAAVDALVAALSDPQGNVRWWSASALGAIGPAAKSAIPALRKALGDKEDLVCRYAKEALEKIDPDGAASRPEGKR